MQPAAARFWADCSSVYDAQRCTFLAMKQAGKQVGTAGYDDAKRWGIGANELLFNPPRTSRACRVPTQHGRSLTSCRWMIIATHYEGRSGRSFADCGHGSLPVPPPSQRAGHN